VGQIFAGLSFTAVFLAVGIRLMKHAKTLKETNRKPKWYRAAAIVMFIAGCGLVGSWFQGFATTIASVVPGPLVGFAAVFCALGVLLDCWGKDNHAGRGTAIVAFIAPLLIVLAPVSMLGINPDELVHGIKGVTQNAQLVGQSGRG
jgi:protein-S-isoprenylcysteine O-methyltransferase Ste14